MLDFSLRTFYNIGNFQRPSSSNRFSRAVRARSMISILDDRDESYVNSKALHRGCFVGLPTLGNLVIEIRSLSQYCAAKEESQA